MLVISLSLFEGKYFPNNPNQTIVWIATFRGKSLSSEPVVSTANPIFDTEFTWKCSNEQLKAWKDQRSMVRLQCLYCLGNGTTRTKEGYLLLDLKNSGLIDFSYPTFRSLSGIRTGLLKPQVKLSFKVSSSEHNNTENDKENSPLPQIINTTSKTDYIKVDNGNTLWFFQILFSLTFLNIQPHSVPVKLSFRMFDSCINSKSLSESSTNNQEVIVKLSGTSKGIKKYLFNYLNPLEIDLISSLDHKDPISSCKLSIGDLSEDEIYKDSIVLKSNNDKSKFLLDLSLRLSQEKSATEENIFKTWNHFRLSIDIHSIQLYKYYYSVYCCYSYPAFGSSAPVYTLPPIDLRPPSPSKRSQESVMNRLNNGFNAYEFVFNPADVEKIMSLIPLELQVWQRLTNEKDHLLAYCSIDLKNVFTTGKRFESNKDGSHQFVLDQVYNLLNSDSDDAENVMGCVRVVVSLEDFGMVDENQLNPEKIQELENEIDEMESDEDLDQYLSLWQVNEMKRYTEKFQALRTKYSEYVKNVLKFHENHNEKLLNDKLEKINSLLYKLENMIMFLNDRIEQVDLIDKELDGRSAKFEKQEKSRTEIFEAAKRKMITEMQMILEKEQDTSKRMRFQLESERKKISSIQVRIEELKLALSKGDNEQNMDEEKQLRKEEKLLKNEVESLKLKLRAVEKEKKKFVNKYNVIQSYLENLREEQRLEKEEQLMIQEDNLHRMQLRRIVDESLLLIESDRRELDQLKNVISKAMHKAYLLKVREGKNRKLNVKKLKEKVHSETIAEKPPKFPMAEENEKSFELFEEEKEGKADEDEEEAIIEYMNNSSCSTSTVQQDLIE